MMQNILLATTIVLGLFAAWIVIQHLARLVAHRHPEFGAAREEGGGCGIACLCSREEQATCPNRESPPSTRRLPPEAIAMKEGDRHFREAPIPTFVTSEEKP